MALYVQFEEGRTILDIHGTSYSLPQGAGYKAMNYQSAPESLGSHIIKL